jgi:hypothetical protein
MREHYCVQLCCEYTTLQNIRNTYLTRTLTIIEEFKFGKVKSADHNYESKCWSMSQKGKLDPSSVLDDDEPVAFYSRQFCASANLNFFAVADKTQSFDSAFKVHQSQQFKTSYPNQTYSSLPDAPSSEQPSKAASIVVHPSISYSSHNNGTSIKRHRT